MKGNIFHQYTKRYTKHPRVIIYANVLYTPPTRNILSILTI